MHYCQIGRLMLGRKQRLQKQPKYQCLVLVCVRLTSHRLRCFDALCWNEGRQCSDITTAYQEDTCLKVDAYYVRKGAVASAAICKLICALKSWDLPLTGEHHEHKQVAPVAATSKHQARNATDTRHLMQTAARTLQAPPGGVIVCRLGVKEPVIMMALVR